MVSQESNWTDITVSFLLRQTKYLQLQSCSESNVNIMRLKSISFSHLLFSPITFVQDNFTSWHYGWNKLTKQRRRHKEKICYWAFKIRDVKIYWEVWRDTTQNLTVWLTTCREEKEKMGGCRKKLKSPLLLSLKCSWTHAKC